MLHDDRLGIPSKVQAIAGADLDHAPEQPLEQASAVLVLALGLAARGHAQIEEREEGVLDLLLQRGVSHDDSGPTAALLSRLVDAGSSPPHHSPLPGRGPHCRTRDPGELAAGE